MIFDFTLQCNNCNWNAKVVRQMVNISAPSAILGRNFFLLLKASWWKSKDKDKKREREREKGSFELLVVIPNGMDFHATDR